MSGKQGLLGSIKTAIIGILVILGATIGLVWNEMHSVARYTALEEGRSSVVTVAADALAQQPDAQLVHLQGVLESHDTLTDPMLGESFPLVKLRREVEMYQWVEETKSSSGSSSRRNEKKYRKQWRDHLIESGRFESSSHHNPPDMPYKPQTWVSHNVTLGPVAVSREVLQGYNDYQLLSTIFPEQPGQSVLDTLSTALGKPFHPNGSGFYVFSTSLSNPEIGDMRFKWEAIAKPTVSLVALYNQGRLVPYQAGNSEKVSLVKSGTLSAEEMFEQAVAENDQQTWIFRIVGVIAMMMGCAAVVSPLAALLDWIPMMGGVFSGALVLVSVVVGGVLSAIIIGLAWFAAHPMVGIVLLLMALIGTAVLVGLFSLGRKKQEGSYDKG